MANSIALAQKFLPVIDDIYKAGSVTQILDAKTQNIDFAGVNTVKVLKVSTTGLGDYSRTTGYPKGDVTATWETLTLAEERGKEFPLTAWTTRKHWARHLALLRVRLCVIM